MSKRQEDFQEQAESYANKCGGTTQERCATMTDYFAGCEHGYQYAIEHSDDVIRLIVRMAKKDIAFTEEEAVKFYHEEMEE